MRPRSILGAIVQTPAHAADRAATEGGTSRYWAKYLLRVTDQQVGAEFAITSVPVDAAILRKC